MRGTHRIAVMAVISLLATFLLAGTALAQYPPSGSLTCDTSTVTPGSTFTCTAQGFAPNSTVSVSATGQSTGAAPWTYNTTVTAVAGVAEATIQVPDNATGPVSVSFSGRDAQGNPRVVANAAAVTVVQPSAGDDTAAPAPGAMPATGGDVTGGIIAVVALLVVGGGLLAVTRRRRTNVEV